MNSDDIRSVFIDFFAARDHTIVPSSSLIPNDPTLFLTNAGMVPFKPYMLGEEEPPYRRAVTVQKVTRTIDIDIIGTTARHVTFFEMLGNFSFGDYFKERAIPWAYQLVTDGFGLDPERLWYTVHHTDEEAAEIWIDGVGVPTERVQRLDKDNFWQMGVPGPCGPSSEIFYDKGPEFGEDGGPAVDDERFMEIWNLVFMQNIQDEPYHVIGDLPAKNIDTGAGLERLAVTLQGVESVFETDLLRPLVAVAESASGIQYTENERTDVSLRILADHAKAVSFLLGDKVVPSNGGRGYVVRRLLRRAVRHASLLGIRGLIMPTLIEATVDVMGNAYPELKEQQSRIVELAAQEEERFRRTLASGHQLLDQELAGLGDGDVFPGAAAFKLHDTFGFPRELTEEILAEKGIELDLEEFHRMMEEQKKRARQHYKGGDAVALADAYRSLLSSVDATEFVGYEYEGGAGQLLSIVREGEAVDRAEEGQEVEIFLNRTPFYAESGGQVGDTGTVATATGEVRVFDTRYALPGVHGHRGKVAKGYVQTGQETATEVDRVRRERIRKNHTGTHLLHWALREVVGEHVHQAGSLVAPDRLRFDFSHFTGVSQEELRAVEQLVNDRIIENALVTTLETSKQEAEQMGALAFFGDKYGDRVRVVRAGDYSTEFCGGTHVPSTGQIGPLVLVSEGSVAANTRRLEALTGTAGYGYLSDLRGNLMETADVLHTQPSELVQAASNLASKAKDQEERLAAFEQQARSATAEAMLASVEEHGGKNLLVASVADLGSDELRALAYQLRDRLGGGIGIVGSSRDGKGALIGFVSSDLVAEGVSAADVLRAGSQVLGGGGSRDPAFAQAGGPNGDRLEEALEVTREAAQGALLDR